MSEETEADAIIQAAREAGIPASLVRGEPQVICIPSGTQAIFPELRQWRERPTRKIGTYRPADVDSLLMYAKRHEEDGTTIWINPTNGKTVAVVNDHSGSDPGWADHRAVLELKTTPEWDHWIANDGKMMSQVEFAEHIEEGLDDIGEPDGATMLEIAQSFHASNSATFRTSTRLHSGEQRLQYDENVQASAGASGDLTVPTQILIAVEPFYGERRANLRARLRFRLAAGHLTLGYKLDRPDAVKRHAIEAMAEKITSEFGQVYLGEPVGVPAETV